MPAHVPCTGSLILSFAVLPASRRGASDSETSENDDGNVTQDDDDDDVADEEPSNPAWEPKVTNKTSQGREAVKADAREESKYACKLTSGRCVDMQ